MRKVPDAEILTALRQHPYHSAGKVAADLSLDIHRVARIQQDNDLDRGFADVPRCRPSRDPGPIVPAVKQGPPAAKERPKRMMRMVADDRTDEFGFGGFMDALVHGIRKVGRGTA